jgi:hypothetical protein
MLESRQGIFSYWMSTLKGQKVWLFDLLMQSSKWHLFWWPCSVGVCSIKKAPWIYGISGVETFIYYRQIVPRRLLLMFGLAWPWIALDGLGVSSNLLGLGVPSSVNILVWLSRRQGSHGCYAFRGCKWFFKTSDRVGSLLNNIETSVCHAHHAPGPKRVTRHSLSQKTSACENPKDMIIGRWAERQKQIIPKSPKQQLAAGDASRSQKDERATE